MFNKKLIMKHRFVLILLISLYAVQLVTGQKDDKKSDKPVTISGKVTDNGNHPVAGAVFYVDNVRTSYFTDEKGEYKIKVSPSALKLRVSSSRFGVCDTLINGQTKINFIFKLNSDALSGIKGPGEASDEKESNPVKPKTKKMNTYNNIYQMIRTEVSGVLVNGRSIVIQQPNSFFGSSDPLFVVDGVIVNSIDNINPVEVKSISVLTGSSAAIYGVNGANGVLCITLINGSDSEK